MRSRGNAESWKDAISGPAAGAVTRTRVLVQTNPVMATTAANTIANTPAKQEQLMKKTVKDLKALCADAGTPTTGTKSV